MNDNFFKRMILITGTGLLVIAIILLTTTKSQAADDRVYITMKDVREVVTYTKALEAENKQYKESLESERKAVQDILDEQAKLKEAYTQQLVEQNKTIQRQKRRNTTKDCLLAIAVAAAITLAVTR